MNDCNRTIRKFILRRMRDHQRPGSGSHWDPVRDRKISIAQLSEWRRVSDVLVGIEYIVVGRLATNQYSPPQSPIDSIKIAVRPADFTKAKELAVCYPSENKRIEVTVLDDEWAEEAFSRPHKVAEQPILALPYLLLLKMRCQSAQDIADAQRMLHGAGPDKREQIREVFRRYAPEDVADLEELIRLSDEAW